MSFFDSKSAPAVKLKAVGDSVTGVIDRPYTESQVNEVKRVNGAFVQGPPKFYENGDPVMQAVVVLRTDERDPAKADDDGLRTLYVQSAAMKKAIGLALKGAGAPDLTPGGKLTLKRVALYDQAAGGVQDLFTADYEPAASGGLFGGNEASAPAAPSAPAASSQPNVAEQVKMYVDAGLTAPQIADIVGQPVEVVQAIIKAAAPF